MNSLGEDRGGLTRPDSPADAAIDVQQTPKKRAPKLGKRNEAKNRDEEIPMGQTVVVDNGSFSNSSSKFNLNRRSKQADLSCTVLAADAGIDVQRTPNKKAPKLEKRSEATTTEEEEETMTREESVMVDKGSYLELFMNPPLEKQVK